MRTPIVFATLLICAGFAGAAFARPYASLSGLAAAADSAITAGTNPAGITRFDRSAYQVEVLAFYSESEWESQVGDMPLENSTEYSDLVVPAGYAVWPISERLSASFTVLGVGFSDDLGDWPGRYFVESYDSVNVSAFPSVAYRLTDSLSVAASLALTYASFEQTRAVANLFDPGVPPGSAELETDGLDAGFGLSLLHEVSERTRWGLNYLSETDPTMEGKVKYRGVGPNTKAILEEAGFVGADVEVKSRTPQSIVAGVYHEFENRHAFTVDLVWSDFSRFKLSEFYFDGEGLAENVADYEDIWGLSASYSWPVHERWMLGVGGFYVDDMIDDDKRTMTLRLDSMWSLGVAAEWQWTDRRKVQIGLSYITLDDAPLTTPEIPGIGSVSGKFTQRDTFMLRVGLSFGAL
jgi:long-chain fatty acid transport protein